MTYKLFDARSPGESTRLLLIRPPRGAHLVNKTLNDTRVMNGRPIFKKIYTIVLLKVQKNTNAIWYDTVVKSLISQQNY
jgi:hypothetical protein